MIKRLILARFKFIIKSPAWMEIAVIYMAGVLPFLGSLVRDLVIVAKYPVVEANSFYRFFFLSNLISLIPVEYIWTKYNSLKNSHIRIPVSEIGFLIGLNIVVSIAVFKSANTPTLYWILIPPLNIFGAYPIGICNGLKKYLPAKLISSMPNIIMAILALVISFYLPLDYVISLLAIFPISFCILLITNRLQLTLGCLDFKKMSQSIFLNAIPLIIFYLGNFLLLSLNRQENRAVLWGNRISNYLFTFLLLGVPVFINVLKNLSVKIHLFRKYVQIAAIAVAPLFAIAIFIIKNNLTLGLIILNINLSILSIIIYYVTKIIIVQKVNIPEGGS